MPTAAEIKCTALLNSGSLSEQLPHGAGGASSSGAPQPEWWVKLLSCKVECGRNNRVSCSSAFACSFVDLQPWGCDAAVHSHASPHVPLHNSSARHMRLLVPGPWADYA